jgi:hypothetical protein
MSDELPEIELERYLNKLRNSKELASELGVSTDYVKAMKWHGFTMPGGKASVRMARGFLDSCEPFGVLATKRRPKPQERPDASSGKSHAPLQTHAPRKPSSGSPKNRLRTAV